MIMSSLHDCMQWYCENIYPNCWEEKDAGSKCPTKYNPAYTGLKQNTYKRQSMLVTLLLHVSGLYKTKVAFNLMQCWSFIGLTCFKVPKTCMK